MRLAFCTLVLVACATLTGCTFKGPYSTQAELAAASTQDLITVNQTMRRGYKAPLPRDQSIITYQGRLRQELARRIGTGQPQWDQDASRGVVTKGMNKNHVLIAWGWSDGREYAVSGSAGSDDFWQYTGRVSSSFDSGIRIDGRTGWQISRAVDDPAYQTTVIFSDGRVSLVQSSGHN